MRSSHENFKYLTQITYTKNILPIKHETIHQIIASFMNVVKSDNYLINTLTHLKFSMWIILLFLLNKETQEGHIEGKSSKK